MSGVLKSTLATCYTNQFSTELRQHTNSVLIVKRSTQAGLKAMGSFKGNYLLVMKPLPGGTESQHSGNKIFGVKREGVRERIKG